MIGPFSFRQIPDVNICAILAARPRSSGVSLDEISSNKPQKSDVAKLESQTCLLKMEGKFSAGAGAQLLTLDVTSELATGIRNTPTKTRDTFRSIDRILSMIRMKAAVVRGGGGGIPQRKERRFGVPAAETGSELKSLS